MPRLLRLFVLVAVAAGVVAAPVVTPPGQSGPADVAQAADARLFDAANIISDALFYDGSSMSPSAVQKFLTAKGTSCVAGEMPCLKDYTQDTATQAADSLCNGYKGVRDETAAAIISKVGASCSINPRVLLVLLQKEQSLVRGTRPTARQYTKATGFACPDTAPCNPAFKGFVSQVYFAARQFQRYKEESWAPYKAFRTNTIQYHPRSACGTSQVYIKNYATAGLYSYTPYRPNAAALRAQYAEGDSCSAYGNRNFWLYYTDWFGSTQSPGGDAVVQLASSSAWKTKLGDALTYVRCDRIRNGCYQRFEGGSIYWSAATGAHVISPTGGVRDKWVRSDKENGRLGYPIAEEVCGRVDGGCYQRFEGGTIYWSADSGGQVINNTGGVRDAWVAGGREQGDLGYPISSEACGRAGGGCFQRFQGGSLYWSPATGAHVISTTGAVREAWVAAGKEDGPLGYPRGEEACDLVDGGCWQAFQTGWLFWSADSGAHVISRTGAIRAAWVAANRENGDLGYPLTDEDCGLAAGGCAQQFQGGWLYWSTSSGAHVVAATGPVRDRWTTTGAEGGSLGYPVGEQTCGLADGGCAQDFQKGAVYAFATKGTFVLPTAIRDRWTADRAASGPLGFPVSEADCGLTGGGCVQGFEGGSVYWSAKSGAHVVATAGEIRDTWVSLGQEHGALAYPTSTQACAAAGGCRQRFQGGWLYSSPSTGTHVVKLSGPISTAWVAAGGHRGALGYPLTSESCGRTDGGCYQRFAGGSLYWSPATGAHVIAASGPVRDLWVAARKERGVLGYPTSDQRCDLVDGGCGQKFRGGYVYWSPDHGAFIVRSPLLDRYKALSAEKGRLGYPVANAVRTTTHDRQRFEGGEIIRNRKTGNTVIR